MGRKIVIPKIDLEYALELALTREQMAERFKCGVITLDRNMKENNLKYLGAKHFHKGEGNPAKRKEVKHKIANTVTTLWEEGYYADRVNGMSDVTGLDNPNTKGHKWTYRDYISQYQELKCTDCNLSLEEGKIDVHHIDEDHDNWLLTNLVPLCVKCHQKRHYKNMKQPYVTIGVKGHFDSSHNLLNYSGKCARVHGHRYFYEVEIRDRINKESGMVKDFGTVKKMLKEGFEEVVDHAYLNDILPFNSTAENMIVWMFEYLSKRQLLKGLVKISLWETPECVATFTNEDMLEFFIETKTDALELKGGK